MTRKGGGRESGPTGDTGVVRATETGRAAVESLADFIIPKAAVNPAACPMLESSHGEHDERIRELEAELMDQKRGYDEIWLVARKNEVRAEKAEIALQKALHARDERSPPRP